jgi:hypothetical protein
MTTMFPAIQSLPFGALRQLGRPSILSLILGYVGNVIKVLTGLKAI